MHAYRKRESYDPALGRYEDWAFVLAFGVVRDYRKHTARRVARLGVTIDGLLEDIATDGLNPEEVTDLTMMRRLLKRCLKALSRDARARPSPKSR